MTSLSVQKGDYAGAGLSDARLLLFPVKSMKGVFAWITCPRVLNRFISELSLCNDPKLDLPKSISARKIAGYMFTAIDRSGRVYI